MSAQDSASQVVTAYHDAEDLFNIWRKQRNETIQKIRAIANDIQQFETIYGKGHAASVGTVAGVMTFGAMGVMTIAGILGAPFTFGGSILGCSVAGSVIRFTAGIVDEANNTHTWLNSSKIKSKCDKAAMLLRDGEVLTKNLLGKLEHFHVLQSDLCKAVGVKNLTQITLRTLGSMTGLGGELIDFFATNIPNMARSSEALSFIFGFGEMNFGVSFTAQNVGKSLALAVGKQAASSVARSSLRVIGTAAVGVGVVTDVLTIVNNKQALMGITLCDQTRALKDTADTMETEMNKFDYVFNLEKMSELQSKSKWEDFSLDKKKTFLELNNE